MDNRTVMTASAPHRRSPLPAVLVFMWTEKNN